MTVKFGSLLGNRHLVSCYEPLQNYSVEVFLIFEIGLVNVYCEN